jgi:hypothetical protein
MIEIERRLVRRLRAVFRKLSRVSLQTGKAAVSLETRADGLHVRLHQHGAQAEWFGPGSSGRERIVVPLEMLAECEGSTGVVQFDSPHERLVRARWEEARVPQQVEFDAPDEKDLPAFPSAASSLADNPPELWTALAEAGRTAAAQGVRYATDHLQLRGAAGEIVATDSRQLLIQSGFSFPFKDDVIIPNLPIYGCKELERERDMERNKERPSEVPLALGKEADTLTLRRGDWTFFLPVAAEKRFPRGTDVVPSASRIRSRVELAPEDAAFLLRTLACLPGTDEENSPVTLDLNGQMIVRAQGANQERPTELVLARSQVEGNPARFAVSRELLGRAVRLGFRTLQITDGDSPILAEANLRQYVFMPLGKKGSLAGSPDAVRIVTTETESPPSFSSISGRQPNMTSSQPDNNPPSKGNDNGNGNGRMKSDSASVPPARSTGIEALIGEAEALKAILRDGHARAGSLLAALKRQRQQSKLLDSTMTALRQLQDIGG